MSLKKLLCVTLCVGVLAFVLTSMPLIHASSLIKNLYQTIQIGFGTGGKVVTDFSPAWVDGYDLALQEDGKLVVAGQYYSQTRQMLLMRYMPNGLVDTTFGDEGIVVSDFEYDSYAYAVDIQPDGKIVSAGFTWMYFSLLRHNVDGSLDTSFNSTGIVTTSFNMNASIEDIAIQSDNKIVVMGTMGYDNFSQMGGDITLARYNTDGSLDTSFNNTGIITANLDGTDRGFAVAIQNDGKIVAVGVSNEDFVTMRYNVDGSLDSSFGSTGVITADFGNHDIATDVHIQTDGKILVAGNVWNLHYAMVRYNPDGTLDTSFGNEGKMEDDYDGSGTLNKIALQFDGKIVVVGQKPYDFGLARYNTDGSLDQDFGTWGYIVTDFGGYDVARGVVILPNGKIVASGDAGVFELAMARYLENGELDSVAYATYLPLILR